MVGEKAQLDFADSDPQEQEGQLQQTARRWRLVLRTVFLVLATLFWMVVAQDAANEHRRTLAAVAQRDSNLAIAVEHYIVRILRTSRAVHRLLGAMAAQGRSEHEMVEMLADRLRANDALGELGICLPDGRVLPSPARTAVLTGAACARILASVRRGPEITVLPPVGPAGALQVPLALPLDDGAGTRAGVAVALAPVDTMLGVMQSTVLHDDTIVLLAGTDGVPRAGWRTQAGAIHDPAAFEALAVLGDSGPEARIGGHTYLVATRLVPGTDLRIHVASATVDALAEFDVRRARLVLLASFVTIGLLAMYRLLSRMHARGLARSRALVRARGALQELNGRLDKVVQERTAQLEQAFSDLETFSYAVAHDVRAPLASIAGFAAALEPVIAATGSDKDRHYLNRIQANAARLDHLTQHLLDLGRLTRAPLVHTRVNLSAVATEVLARLREAEPGRQVVARVEPGLWALGDRALLRQVMENLLGNAWKFTGRRSPAHIEVVRARDADGTDLVVVGDDGDGFDSEQAAGLFQPFRRMHSPDEFPGTGVGLAAVHRIVALHGGRVWCQSRRGAGARFFLALPARAGE